MSVHNKLVTSVEALNRMRQDLASNGQPPHESVEILWYMLEELEERVTRLEDAICGVQGSMNEELENQPHQGLDSGDKGEAHSLVVMVERACFPTLKVTPTPDKAQLNRMVDELTPYFPEMTRKKLTQSICEFFRKSREYMNGRLDTALRNHFVSFRIESMEDARTLLDFTIQNNSFVDHIRDKASIDIEEEGAARSFVQKRIHRFVMKLVERHL